MGLPSNSYIWILEYLIFSQLLGWNASWIIPGFCDGACYMQISHIHTHHQAFDTVIVYLFEYLHLCARPFWWELTLAAPLTSRDLYELRTDPSSLSRADLRRGNENNEQRGPRQSGSCPTGPHCTMGHRTGRQGTRGPHYQVCSPYRERGSREQRGRAEGTGDDGWGSSRALAADRSERQEWGLWLGLVRGSRCWQHDRLCQQESLKWSLQYESNMTLFLLLLHYMYAQEICKIIKNFLLTCNNFIHEQEIRSCSWFMLVEQQELREVCTETCDQ